MSTFVRPEDIAASSIDLREAQSVHRRLSDYFDSGATRDTTARRDALRRLGDAVRKYEAAFFEALTKDLDKPRFETYTTEIGFVYQDLEHTLARLDKWTAPQSVGVGLALWPTTAQTRLEPKGVVLVVSPWNYPVNLALAPLIAAVAAGCCVVVKPAEDTPHTSAVLGRVIAEAFADGHVAVVQGPGALVVPTLMGAARYDHVFYTGSTRVGREIGIRCAEQMTTCTLELGGKSPAVVFADAPTASTIDRLVWGKCINAGQTCVAPDYVLVERSAYREFLRELSVGITAAYGRDPLESPDLASVINASHFERLTGLLAGVNVVHGGRSDSQRRRIEPTVVTDVDADHPLRTEEVFGPILTVLPFDDWDDAKAIIAQHPEPLAAYVFTADDAKAERFVTEVRFGGGCVNDTIIHLGIPGLPFGGVGASGHGRYHGAEGVRAFSNVKSVARTSGTINPPTRYAPYSDLFYRAARWLIG